MSPHPVIPPLTITTPGIQKLLGNINPHKASGPDNISGRILKDLQNFTAPILTIIFQKSLQTGCIPSDWKHTNVAPAYKKVKNTTQQIKDQSLSLVSVVKIWNMSLQNTCLTIWKATVYYMIFNMASDILDPVKPNYCPLFKNLLQIQIKIFKLISLSWTLPNPLTKFHINDFYTNSDFMESNIKLDLCLFIKPYTNSGSGWRVIRYCSGHFWCPSGNSSGSCSFSGIYNINDLSEYMKSSQLRLFADDSIIYITIKSQKDCDSLQRP